MPEHVSRLDSTLPEIPAAAGRGAIFSPLPQDMQKIRMRAHTVQTIGVDAQTLSELWKSVALAPRWLEYVVSAEPKSATLTHWVLGNPEEPNGRRLEYDTEIVEDIPGEKIAWRKAVHMAMGQTHMHKYLKPLLKPIEDGRIDPSFLISHRVGIEEVPDMYKIWRDKKDQVTKIVIDPWRDQIGDRIAA